MAMFHFRLKSDKKPNGTKISAIKHVEYINREGTFAHDEHWKESNKFVEDFITTEKTPNALNGLEILLYKTDDFGSIKNSERGIEVTENASPTTLYIALMLATQTMNDQPLIIHGSPDFHKAVLQTALLANLPVTFADRLLQKEFQRLKERKANDDKNSLQTEDLFSLRDQIPSPVLRQLMQNQSKMQPKTDFACQPHTPNALWFIQNQKELTCFCRLMNLVSWTPSQKTAISMCDGIFLQNKPD